MYNIDFWKISPRYFLIIIRNFFKLNFQERDMEFYDGFSKENTADTYWDSANRAIREGEVVVSLRTILQFVSNSFLIYLSEGNARHL